MGATLCSLVALAFGWIEAAGATPGAAQLAVRSRRQMGTTVTISVCGGPRAGRAPAMEAAFAEVDRLARRLSSWRADSELNALNRAAGGPPRRVSPALFAVLAAAQRLARASRGAFDVTAAAYAPLWDFKRGRIPTAAALTARRALVGHQLLKLLPGRRVALRRRGMRVGLAAIAKGYIVDRASAVLARRGFGDHLVVAGGDLFAAGSRCGRPWRIGVRDPAGGRTIRASLEVRDAGVATSGTYEQGFWRRGVRYHHILDPRSGRPARGVTSATAVAASAMLADGAATAALVLGVSDGQRFARRQRIELLLFDERHAATATPTLARRLRWISRGSHAAPPPAPPP